MVKVIQPKSLSAKKLDFSFLKLRQVLSQVAPNLPLPRSLQSAVVVAVDPYALDEPTLILTKRAESVETHKGQISFPGGYFEEGDADLKTTAVREFEEEIGGQGKALDILGCLSTVYTHVKVPIVPWLGIITAPQRYIPNSTEVDRLIFLPVSRLILEGLKATTVRVGVARIETEGILVDGEMVWGATARILMNFRECLIGSS